MTGGPPFQGSLFAEDFLRDSIGTLDDWQAIPDSVIDELGTDLRKIFDNLPTNHSPNESQTEDDLIWPVLDQLGWTQNLKQQNLSFCGREDVPDGLLFTDAAAKQRANQVAEEWARYEHGEMVVESKRWLLPLDRQSRGGEKSPPSTQMLRYLRRIDDLTTGKLRWGILTNGAHWRLYYAGARSVSEQFFEIDLAAVLDLPGHNDGLFALPTDARRHWLKVFALVFRREAFVSGPTDGQTFHQRAIAEARFYQERVAANLSDLVFRQVFPDLARALAAAEPDAPLSEVRDAALVLLYRLLFILYAEDRDLLPVRDSRYDDYALRKKVRGDIGRRKDQGDAFSDTAAIYWAAFDNLCRVIDIGDASIGLPPYNGGLFDRERAPLLAQARLPDTVMADAIDALSFERTPDGRHYINYRDLGVQQLGSIYERLLEQEVVLEGGEVIVRPNVFVRKNSGSFYTPDDLVSLIVAETLDPLARRSMDAFAAEAAELPPDEVPENSRMARLKALDPAERLLDLKICDPAMGSGHFLVNLVDHLADRVITAMAEAEDAVEGYVSPLTQRIDSIRNTIMANAEESGWALDRARLDDRHIVRRMVLKRCVYGVDKNAMAVELAKVSLWLHTFTVGAPLSFLDHHLRCGDSLFGAWVRPAIDRAESAGGPLFLNEPLSKATRAAAPMQDIEGSTDAEIAEANRSADIFAEVSAMTGPLNAFLRVLHALEWLGLRDAKDREAYAAWLDGSLGDPIGIAQGACAVETFPPEKAASLLRRKLLGNAAGLAADAEHAERFAALLRKARTLIESERFLNWQVAFPGVWQDWEKTGRRGGFDAVIGNPPWDRMKLQQVEWFAARRPDIAKAPRAADRKRMIAELQKKNEPLAEHFAAASAMAANAARMARKDGDYPLLSGGDVNLYSLFVERAMALAKPDGMVGLLVPSGIASDKTAARFFKDIATEGRLKALYDFENRRTRYNAPPFFPDVDSRFKFCAFLASSSPLAGPAQCAFFLQDVAERHDPERCFPLSAEDFARVNPNTGTAPIFRTRRDAELTTAIYERLPVLVDRSSGEAVKTWPVKYKRMFDMANDSHLFRTREELEEKEHAWPSAGNRFNSADGEWLPLYEGKMVQAFDHRAADIVVNPKNLFRTGQSGTLGAQEKSNPERLPEPRYWVLSDERRWDSSNSWVVSFKDITASTNMRTMIAALIPFAGAGHTLPVLPMDENESCSQEQGACFMAANLNAVIFDYVARQKVPTTHFAWYVLEQLPVVPPERYEAVRFGPKTAAEIVREAVLELTYTAHDMAPFARDLGHVDESGEALPPFPWDANRRLRLRAKLDALYFHLYGIANRDDIRHIYSTFPIVRRQEEAAHGRYRSLDLCLAWHSALAAANPDAEIEA